MKDPIGVAVCHRRKELEQQGLDFRLEKGGGHQGEKRFKVMLNEVHDNEDSAYVHV